MENNNTEKDKISSYSYKNPLQLAVISGNLELVKELLDTYPLNYQINKTPRSYKWDSPLTLAIQCLDYESESDINTRFKIVQELINNGATSTRSTLSCALNSKGKDKLALIELLLKAGADPNDTLGCRWCHFPIYFAINNAIQKEKNGVDKLYGEYQKVIYLLLEYGARVDVIKIIYSGDQNNSIYYKYLYKILGSSTISSSIKNLGMDKLQLAAIEDTDCHTDHLSIEKIMKQDTFGMTPLMWACARGNLVLVQRIFNFLNQDQYKGLITDYLELCNYNGDTAVSLANKHNPMRLITDLRKSICKICNNAIPMVIINNVISNLELGSELLKKHDNYDSIIWLLATPYCKEIMESIKLPKSMTDLILGYTIGS